MIFRGMRKDIPAEQQTHFLPILDRDWKKLSTFPRPTIPTSFSANPQGRVIWQTHGPLTDASYEALKAALSKFLAAPGDLRFSLP